MRRGRQMRGPERSFDEMKKPAHWLRLFHVLSPLHTHDSGRTVGSFASCRHPSSSTYYTPLEVDLVIWRPILVLRPHVYGLLRSNFVFALLASMSTRASLIFASSAQAPSQFIHFSSCVPRLAGPDSSASLHPSAQPVTSCLCDELCTFGMSYRRLRRVG